MNTDLSREDRFEERLLTAILDDFDQLTAPAAQPRRARPSGRRRVAVSLAAGAAAAGIAAASIAAGGAAKPGQHATGGTAQTATSPKLHNAAYVVDHLSSALNANTAVVDIIDHAPDSQTGKPVLDEIWSSSLSDTYRIVDMTQAGQPTTGYLVTVKPHRTTSIVVDYGNRTWCKTIYPFGSSSDGRRAAGPAPSPLQLAAQLRAKVKAGQVTLVGWATVDGQRAIHLRERMTHGQVNLWVDPDSYLPIREIDTAPGVSPTSGQAIRDDYEWLPATKANLRLLTPVGAIPPASPRPPRTEASDWRSQRVTARSDGPPWPGTGASKAGRVMPVMAGWIGPVRSGGAGPAAPPRTPDAGA